MDTLVSLIDAIVWPIAVLLLAFLFRRDIREILSNITSLQIETGGNKAIVELMKKHVMGAINTPTIDVNAVAETPYFQKEKLAEAINAIDELASLTSTQTKILLILGNGAAQFSKIAYVLRDLYYSGTRPRVIRQLLGELVELGLVSLCSNDEFALTEKGKHLVVADSA